MNYQWILVLGLGLFLGSSILFAQDFNTKEDTVVPDLSEIPVDRFLEMVRYPPTINCWFKLQGHIVHYSGRGYKKMPLELRARFQEHSWRFQVLLGSGEVWFVRQVFRDGIYGTTQIQQRPPREGELTLAEMMLRPEDISLSFLYWNLEKEFPMETVSLLKCRVLQLKHPKAAEWVKVWISVQFLFPVKVQWAKDEKDKYYRELNFRGVKEFQPPSDATIKLAIIDSAKVYGEGWKTMFLFSEVEGDIVTPEKPAPSQLFEKIVEEQRAAPDSQDKPK